MCVDCTAHITKSQGTMAEDRDIESQGTMAEDRDIESQRLAQARARLSQPFLGYIPSQMHEDIKRILKALKATEDELHDARQVAHSLFS